MLLPIHALFISESSQGEEEAEDIDESNGSARYCLLVSLRNQCVITGIILSSVYLSSLVWWEVTLPMAGVELGDF